MPIDLPEVEAWHVLAGAFAFWLEREILGEMDPVTCLVEQRLVEEFLSFRVISRGQRLEWN